MGLINIIYVILRGPSMHLTAFSIRCKVRKGTKIRNWHNQVPDQGYHTGKKKGKQKL